MTQPEAGSFTLFRVAGITVFVHWSWFLMAYVQFKLQGEEYSGPAWVVIEYITLFGIVLLHEFGHALACRQVGGSAEQIVLWPLGGIAYVDPPPRPGAWLWSIAAGPLVNLVLVPVTGLLVVLGSAAGWKETFPDLQYYLVSIAVINLMLLIFNMLPIYPLDGGQILQSLLWFAVGRPLSLKIASIVGVVGGVGLILLALAGGSIWMGIMAAFLTYRAAIGFSHAKMLQQIAEMPRRPGLSCPACREGALQGDFWRCPQCGQPFDMIATQGQCPQCSAQFDSILCPQCGRSHPADAWQQAATDPYAGRSGTGA
ncbi:MAG: site-2 protease family protein [Planctomycetia bacterium]|nr:site-2 protease family protein [Planctomycetia bacterium]